MINSQIPRFHDARTQGTLIAPRLNQFHTAVFAGGNAPCSQSASPLGLPMRFGVGPIPVAIVFQIAFAVLLSVFLLIFSDAFVVSGPVFLGGFENVVPVFVIPLASTCIGALLTNLAAIHIRSVRFRGSRGAEAVKRFDIPTPIALLGLLHMPILTVGADK